MSSRIAFCVLVSAFALACSQPAVPSDATGSALPMAQALERPVSFDADVRPVLERRCAVCHGCYDAPCQLLLTSAQGALRGATKQPVYDSTRLHAMDPTRLGVDATTPAQWRARGFFSVTDSPDSLLLHMLALGRAHPLAPNRRLPELVKLDVNRPLTCAAGDEFQAYEKRQPLGGMPYGVAPLSADELQVLVSWVAQGAPPPEPPALAPAAAAEVKTWETFLNGAALRERVVARYLYEHWFVAHLYFDDLAKSPFFKVVRSKTPPGQPIEVVATVRPYDDPGGQFWYRLQPVDESIVHKTHIVYALGPKRLARLRALFLAPRWQPTHFPSWAPEAASNPFTAFAEIPSRARYQFMLDDAQYFVMTFIRGPVCRGQIAVDVIEDRFFVSFVDPDHDLSITDPAFLAKATPELGLPAAHGSRLVPGALYLEYAAKQRKYLDERFARYAAADPKKRGPTLGWIWDGDGRNPNAQLTVFRNYDNATVLRGFVGTTPKTAWVMDYPIFERIYYDLVAGFDVFGDLEHQVATRLYMDHLRMQSENLFLSFLPADERESLRASWYVDATHTLDYRVADDLNGREIGTQIKFKPGPPMAQLFAQLVARSAVVAGQPGKGSANQRAAEVQLKRLEGVKGPWVALMPEVSLLRVRVDPTGRSDLVYGLVHDVAHENVAFMFGEAKRLVPADDELTLIRGQFGSYPNFFFEVNARDLVPFVDHLLALRTDADLERFVDQFGIRRTDPRFWETSDWLREDLKKSDPIGAGIYDLDRYGNL